MMRYPFVGKCILTVGNLVLLYSPTESDPKRGSGKKSTGILKGKKKIKGLIDGGEAKVSSCRGFRSKLADTSATQSIRRNLTEAESKSELCKATSVHANSAYIHSESKSGAESMDESSDDASEHDITGEAKTVKKKRFIVFLGNLRNTISKDDIISHFEKRGVPISEFRLLTHKDSGKSKGCGFMELRSNVVMQNALKFHRSRLLGKHINMEVTCGGGGKGVERRKRIHDKNKKLRLQKAAQKPVKHKTVG